MVQELAAQRAVVEEASQTTDQTTGIRRQNVINRSVAAEALRQDSMVNAAAALGTAQAFPTITERTRLQTVINRPRGTGREEEPPVSAVAAPGPMLRRLEAALRLAPAGEAPAAANPAPAAANVEVIARMAVRMMVEASEPEPEPAGRRFNRVG
jgi:hypothetical protein